jgi:hypothetical protein
MPHGFDESGAVRPMPWISFDNAAPAGSVVSCVSEMANWLVFHLDEGRFDGRQVLKPDTMRELHATQNLRAGRGAFPLENVTGALGWFRAEYRGRPNLSHGGGMLGFPAYVTMLPADRIGVVVLSNGPTMLGDDYKFHRSIAYWVVDRLLGLAPEDWSRKYLAERQEIEDGGKRAWAAIEAARRPAAPASLPLERYAGDYEDRKVPSGLVHVGVEDGGLVLRFDNAGAFTGHLEHWHRDVFRLHSRAPGHNIVEFRFVEFTLGPAGEVGSLTLSSAYFRLTLDRVAS